MEISEILFLTMTPTFKRILDEKCLEYETSEKYEIKRFYEEMKLVGFCVKHDENGVRYLDEAHYIGHNKFVSVKMWKWLTKDANKLRLFVQKTNKTMFDFYSRIGFQIIGEDNCNYLMERGG